MMDEPCQKSKKGTVLQVVEQGSLALVVLLGSNEDFRVK